MKDFLIFPPSILIAFAGCLLMVKFFISYGLCKFPIYSYLPMLLNTFISIIVALCLIPIDILINTNIYHTIYHEYLYKILGILYSIDFAMVWLVIPVLLEIYEFKDKLSLKRRVLSIILKEIFKYFIYGILVFIVFISYLVILYINKFSILPYITALTNAFGIIFISILFGYGFVQMPKYIWKMGSPVTKYIDNLKEINNIGYKAVQSLMDANMLLKVVDEIGDRIPEDLKQNFDDHYLHYKPDLIRMSSFLPLPKMFHGMQRPQESVDLLKEKLSVDIDQKCLENILHLANKIVSSYNKQRTVINSDIQQAYNDLLIIKNRNIKVIWQKQFFSIIIGIICLVCLWSEFSICLPDEFRSIFYYLNQFNYTFNELFRTILNTMAIGFYFFVAYWSMTHFEEPNLRWFIKGASDQTPMYYITQFIGRTSTSIGFNYMLQLDIEKSELFNVIGDISQSQVFNVIVEKISPMLMLFIFIISLFDIPNIIMKRIYSKGQQNNILFSSVSEFSDQEEIIMFFSPKISELLENNPSLRYINLKSVATTKTSKYDEFHIDPV